MQDRIKKLEARLPRVVLSLTPIAPSETTVREGEATLGAAATYGVPLPLDPGTHHLVVLAPGYSPKSIDVTLTEGKTTTLAIEPGPQEAAPSPPAAPKPTAPPRAGAETPPAVPAVVTPPSSDTESPPRATESTSPGPWIIGGFGVAGIIVGAVTGGVVLQKKSVVNAHCTDGPPPTCMDQTGMDAASAVRTLGPVTTVSLVLGAAGVTTGAVWLGLSRSEKSSARFGVGPTHGGAVWRLEGTW